MTHVRSERDVDVAAAMLEQWNQLRNQATRQNVLVSQTCSSVVVVNHDDTLSQSYKEHVVLKNSCEEVSLSAAINYDQESRSFRENY